NAELACLIREKFTDKEIEKMGLIWIVAMHEPINDYDGDPFLLNAYRLGLGRWLHACSDGPDYGWHRVFGFAFAVSQVSSKILGTLVPLNLALSPVPIHRNGAKFFIKIKFQFGDTIEASETDLDKIPISML
ncbi:MAG: hypothetical protein AAB646_02735, partial [Patescibacteria group bacterium]